jgi:hypothetical protein
MWCGSASVARRCVWCGSTAHVVWDSSVLKHRIVWRHVELLTPDHRGAPTVVERSGMRVRRRGHSRKLANSRKFGEDSSGRPEA